MSSDSEYLKDIERYFLWLKGSGVMLSSRDYNLVLEWKNRGIPKDKVINGIKRAVETDPKSVKSLYNCRFFVEGTNETSEKANVETCSDNDQITHINNIISRIENLLSNETSNRLVDQYSRYRPKIEALKNENSSRVFPLLQRLENEYFDSFFNSLTTEEKYNIRHEATSLIPENTSFLNDRVREDTVRAFRNELIEKRYGLVNIFEYD